MAFKCGEKKSNAKNIGDKNLVNTSTPYERSIAAKLEQLPAPDMVDSIWSNIERQLDAAPDAPDGNSPAKKPSLHIQPWIWYGLAGITLAIALVWYYSRKGPENTTPVKVPPAIQQLPP